jgi:hypothetical protein
MDYLFYIDYRMIEGRRVMDGYSGAVHDEFIDFKTGKYFNTRLHNVSYRTPNAFDIEYIKELLQLEIDNHGV